MSSLLPGRASPEGTAAWAQAQRGRLAPDAIRAMGPLSLSSLGIGTYLGPADDATDASYQAAVVRALERGINVIDTASNYRHQRSERAVGRALAGVLGDSGGARDQLLVASKAGFLAFDGARPANPRATIQERLVDRGLCSWDEIAAGCHTLAPAYLRHTLARSRENLGLCTIDVYYLHNPETQLEELPRPEFLARMRAAFEVLEQAADDGAIGCYGAATWNGFRVGPAERGHLSLAELCALAREVGGAGHRFRVVQLPLNPAMPEALTSPTQAVGGARLPALAAAGELGLQVMSSASIHQGKLDQVPAAALGAAPPRFTPAQRALAWTLAAPGLGTALVGMKTAAHVDENAAVMAAAPAPGPAGPGAGLPVDQ